jgi:hypothetical protein
MFFSCGGDGNGDGDSSSSVTFSSSSDTFVCPTSEVQLCVGTGSDIARLFIQWNDSETPDPMVWIYRFNSGDPSQNKGIDMIFAIAKADSNFGALVSYNDTLGWTVGGFGYFFSGVRKLDSSGTPVFADSNGLFKADSAALFDYYAKLEFDDRWASGWFTEGFWSYQVNIEPYTSNTLIDTSFTWSMVGASTRVLANDSADYYDWQPPYVPPSSSSNGGDPSSSSSEEISASAKINIEEIHPANRNIRRKP